MIDDITLIRWALTHAMETQSGVSVAWNGLILQANGNHLSFSELNDSRYKAQNATIQKASAEIWRELHPRTVD